MEIIGILNQAIKAKQKTERAEEFEQVQLSILEILENNENITKEILDNKLKATTIEVKKDEYIYKGKYRNYKITSDGTVKITGNAFEITKEDIGKNVNYNNSNWQVLYADYENIYIISEKVIDEIKLEINDYTNSMELNNSHKYPAAKKWLQGYIDSNTNTWYESNYNNIKATLFLLDSEGVWNPKFKNEFADYIIGGPTLELICASYNLTNNTDKKVSDISNYGYPEIFSRKEALLRNTSVLNNGEHYWLASPNKYTSSSVNFVRWVFNDVESWNYNQGYSAGIRIRPVACLNEDVYLIKKKDGDSYKFNIEK